MARDLFAAIFFVFFGLSIDPSTIPPVLFVAVALAIVTAETKASWLGSAPVGLVSVRLVGVGRRAAAVLVARGEFSIVIAELAVTADVHPQLGPMSAAYVLLLAISGPIVARAVR